MNTPFRLDDHKRWSQPLAPPPDRYFEQLPTRVMARVQPTEATGLAGTWGWLQQLSAPVRTALASAVVLGGFATSFWLTQPGAPTTSAATAALATVPQAEMVQYLLASDQRVTLTDLAELSEAPSDMSEAYLQASPAELQDALDSQPSDEAYF
ncbi:hypothetical protein HMJ29_19680 [Hymenobacter taeanensis]|uniref:Uncharacterized protein n=1 Tax=Hymenobacter taeanensis TaxID=2735321 RepID=A0A6M6BMF5_9BACT|nr:MULTISPECIES: hypothetical protein [Hymenobacter]QJX49008.1 hypothetical protein HMJ29_19680 [Hymenobacter taeanensis]UOQ81476.1 hypothetical protein MUN83_01350 [Hymenobacter sp. 5414T-23]